MHTSVQAIVFFLVAFLVVMGWHAYLWNRLLRDTQPPPRWKVAGKIALLTLVTLFLFAMIGGRSWPFDSLRPLYAIGYGWLGTSFLLVVMLLLTDLGKLSARGVRRLMKRAPTNPERRLALARILAGSIAFTGFSSTAKGAVSALGTIPIRRIRVSLSRLSSSMNGTRIVQISDLHIGPILKRSWVESVVAQVMSLEPDLIVITGDLVDGTVENLRDDVAPLAKLKAKAGVFFVTGNHEYYSGAPAWVEHVQQLGIRVLQNENVPIGKGDDAFYLAGVNDFESARHKVGHAHDVAASVRGIPPNREILLLAHQPRSVGDAAKHGVGLQLSGHTHGGQIFPWTCFVTLQQPFVSGLHQVQNTWLYISRGTGFWGPPMRIGAPPEISLIEIYRA